MTSIRHKTPDPDTSPAPASTQTGTQTGTPIRVALDGTLDGADDGYLDAAREAILAVGWSRTTLTDIARRAGVSRMTLYRRWPDMQTMLADLMTREWSRAVGASGAFDALASGSGSPSDTPAGSPSDSPSDPPSDSTALARLAHAVVATVRALRANDLLRRIIELDPELLLPYLLNRRGRSQQQLADLLAGLVAAGQAEGSVREGDPQALARSLLLACHGFTLSAHTMIDPAPSGSHPGRDADVSALDDELAQLVDRYLRP